MRQEIWTEGTTGNLLSNWKYVHNLITKSSYVCIVWLKIWRFEVDIKSGNILILIPTILYFTLLQRSKVDKEDLYESWLRLRSLKWKITSCSLTITNRLWVNQWMTVYTCKYSVENCQIINLMDKAPLDQRRKKL